MIEKQLYILLAFLVIFFAGKSQTYEMQYEVCSEDLHNFTHFDSTEVYFNLVKKRDSCLLGISAPDFEATTLDNKKIDFRSLKGEVILLNFWFIGCQPCREEIPGFNKLVSHYTGKNVTFISITYNSAAIVKKFLKQHPFKFATVADNDEIRRNDFKLSSIWPYTIILNKDGKIVFMQFGTKGEQAFSYFKTIIDKLL